MELVDIRFDGQAVIVTGAGRNLGRAYALELGRRGAAVLVNDIVATRADEVASEIRKAGGNGVPSYASVASTDGAGEIAEHARGEFGSVHALVHNAGHVRNFSFAETPDEALDDIMNVHLRGGFLLTRALWPTMQAQRYGRVVYMSSSSGWFARDGGANYAAAKAGLAGLARALGHEGAPFGIHVNCVLPWAVSEISSSSPAQGTGDITGRYLKAWAAINELGGASAEQVAPLVIFLASNQCSFAGRAYSAAAGRYASVFTGLAPGWLAPRTMRSRITAEDIRNHMGEIDDRTGYGVPDSLADELEALQARLRQDRDRAPEEAGSGSPSC